MNRWLCHCVRQRVVHQIFSSVPPSALPVPDLDLGRHVSAEGTVPASGGVATSLDTSEVAALAWVGQQARSTSCALLCKDWLPFVERPGLCPRSPFFSHPFAQLKFSPNAMMSANCGLTPGSDTRTQQHAHNNTQTHTHTPHHIQHTHTRRHTTHNTYTRTLFWFCLDDS